MSEEAQWSVATESPRDIARMSDIFANNVRIAKTAAMDGLDRGQRVAAIARACETALGAGMTDTHELAVLSAIGADEAAQSVLPGPGDLLLRNGRVGHIYRSMHGGDTATAVHFRSDRVSAMAHAMRQPFNVETGHGWRVQEATHIVWPDGAYYVSSWADVPLPSVHEVSL